MLTFVFVKGVKKEYLSRKDMELKILKLHYLFQN